ncbi:MAG: Pr6Pr family membrane protein [Leifsonia flava]
MRVRDDPAQRPGLREARVAVVLGWVRIAVVAAEIIALIGNFRYVLGFSSFGVANFFGYFTIQSAMIAVVVTLAGGLVLLSGRSESVALLTTRTIVLVYVVLSGIVFGLLAAFSSTRTYQIVIPWSDQLLHFILPAVLLVDWLVGRFLGPRAPAVPWIALAWAVPFPVIWLIFTLFRGDAVGWYPYFFLDPSQVSGPAVIVAYCAGILAVILGFVATFVGLSRARMQHPPDAHASGPSSTVLSAPRSSMAQERSEPVETG